MNDLNTFAATAAILPAGDRFQRAPVAARRRKPGRATVVQWVRKTHGWFGLWGATLGLLFGISGIWLNHRAVLKLPPVAQQRSNTQIALPDPAPADAQALAIWLQTALHLDAPATGVRVEPARPVPWLERSSAAQPADPGERAGRRQTSASQARAERSDRAGGPGDPAGEGGGANRGAGLEGRASGRSGAAAPAADGAQALMQPEHWTVNFGGPQATLQAETWAGNRSVSIRRVDTGLLGTLMNLHKGIGMPVAWILLVDSLAGSLILLSVSGLVLWIMTHRRRAVGYAIFALGCALTVGLAMSRI